MRPKFDIAYIDGDHSALGAALDTCLVLPLVKLGGTVGFDNWTHSRFKELSAAGSALLGEVPHEVVVENEQLWMSNTATSHEARDRRSLTKHSPLIGVCF